MKAQGATEYLVLVSVVLGIALVCIAILVWPTGTTKDAKRQQTDIHFGIAAMEYPDLLQGLVAYYKFDEGSGASAANNRGGDSATFIYGPVWTTGKSGQALGFNGNGSYATTTSGTSTASGATVAAWVNAANLSACNAVCTVVRIGTQSGSDGYHWLYYSGGALNWQYANGTAPRTVQVSYTPPIGEWAHVAATHDYAAREVKFYVNGSQVGSTQASNVVLPVSDKLLRIGAYSTGGHWWNGTIDEALVYNRALSAGEIRLLYENPGYPQ